MGTVCFVENSANYFVTSKTQTEKTKVNKSQFVSSIELISMNGSRVKPITEWNGDKIRVYSDHLSNGVYFLSVVTTQMEFIQKVVIVK